MNDFDLDFEIQAFIETYLSVSSNLSTSTSVDHQRISYEAICRHFNYPHPAGVEIRDSEVDGRHGTIKLRHYKYQNQSATRARFVFIHGGGFILGSLDSHDDICAELCAGTGLNAVSVDYRLAPEFLYPVHLDDVEDAYLETWQPNSILVGVSAGANLAAALAHRLKTSVKAPVGQVLIYPSLGGDLFNLKSYTANANAPLLSRGDILFYKTIRCKNGKIPANDPEFYPLVANDFSALPPTHAFSADIDPLRDDAALYVEMLKAAGVDATWHNEIGLPHDYLRARHTSDKAGDSFRRIIKSIEELARHP
jgi:acetyl esterase